MDFTGNADGTSGQTNLTVKEIDFNSGTISLAVTMPANMACIGCKLYWPKRLFGVTTDNT